MGIWVACFECDIAGALGLHRAAVIPYIRPEIIGFVLGVTLAALIFGEFKTRAGSAAIVGFLLGVLAMIGAMAFLGCPWRANLRLAGGDLTAAVQEMLQHMTAEQAEEARDNLERLQEELQKPKPNRKWYSVSIEGLVKAAENVGKVGAPVIELAGKLLRLLG